MLCASIGQFFAILLLSRWLGTVGRVRGGWDHSVGEQTCGGMRAPCSGLCAGVAEFAAPDRGKAGIRWLGAILSFAFLTACASSETRSIASKSDLQGVKYRKVAVFVENSDPARPRSSPRLDVSGGQIALIIPAPSGSATDAEIEQKIVAAFKDAGVTASIGSAMFKGQKLSNQAKANIIQKNFDAVLYVDVLTNGMREELVRGAAHDGQNISIDGETRPLDIYDQKYNLKPDGTVWHEVPTFQAKCELQDTKSNKIVWSSETIASGGTLVLVSRAFTQIVERLRSDGAI